ncbi:BON domain-containing protein [Actinoplanes sp. NPDC051411]|uniref:BON domain-containing protein n=1 Tax=Actinoplanes sp. NPDC051411 TaxID=3155522 RepID=UPI0034267E19
MPDGPDDDFPDDGQDADEQLVDLAAQALQGDRRVYGRFLHVMVQNSVVILVGEVGSLEAKAAAASRAWAVPGVYDVCNRLTVSAAGDDAW